MALKINKKSEGKLTCASKYDMRNLENFHQSTETLKIGTLMGFFCPKLKMYELKIYRGVMCHDSEERCKVERRVDLSFQN